MPHELVARRTRPKIGLALGSGIARGWAHIGVLRALKQLGIEPDIIAGTSVGALVGGSYLAGQIDTLETWARSLTKLKVFGYLDVRMRSGGMIGGRRLIAEMKQHLGGIRIEQLGAPFAAIATDLNTGHEVWLRDGPLVEALRASFSLPGVFPPIRIDDRWMVDGALVNPVPVSTCRALGAQMVIAVNLNADVIGKARRPEADPALAGGGDLFTLMEDAQAAQPTSRLDALARRMFRGDYDGPSLFSVMVGSLSIVQDRITRSRLAGEPPDVHIAPRLGHIGLAEFDRADESIAEGEAAVERSLPELRDALTLFALPRTNIPA